MQVEPIHLALCLKVLHVKTVEVSSCVSLHIDGIAKLPKVSFVKTPFCFFLYHKYLCSRADGSFSSHFAHFPDQLSPHQHITQNYSRCYLKCQRILMFVEMQCHSVF